MTKEERPTRTVESLKPRAYRIPDVARLLSRSEQAVRTMIARGHLPSRRLGRRVMILADELETCLKSLKPGSGGRS